MVRYLLIFLRRIVTRLGHYRHFPAITADYAFHFIDRRLLGKSLAALSQLAVSSPPFGPIIQNWENNGAVPRKAKFFAIGMMALSCLFMFWQFPERWWIGAVSSVFCSCVAVWMWLRPEA